jgi:hypothetical protein
MSKKKSEKSEKRRFYGQNKLFFENPALQCGMNGLSSKL